jgi:hypothetical protein
LIYQLPNGKVLRLTVEEYLELSDEEIRYVISMDIGESASTPWTGSVLPEKGRKMTMESYEESEDVTGSISFDELDLDMDFLDDLNTD